MKISNYKAIAIGVSAGGLNALSILLASLPADFPIPIIVTQHRLAAKDNLMTSILNKIIQLKVREAEDKDNLEPGWVYLAPPDYHLLIESKKTISLSCEDKVNFARPSIDVLFESAARVWDSELIGVILTGSSFDGSLGMVQIKESGGLTIAEDPETAEYAMMPKSSINTGSIDHVLSLSKISEFINNLVKMN